MAKLLEIPRTALSFGIADTSNNFTLKHENGYGGPIAGTNYETIVEIPNWANNVTATFAVYDPNGNILYSQDNLIRNQVLGNAVAIHDPFPVFAGCKFNLALNAAPGNTANIGGIAYVTTYYKAEK